MSSGRFPLIEMVQKVLEALGSDEVNSISDTVEATQVARLLEDTFYELLNQKDWPFLRELIQLESVADSAQPTTLRIPDNVVRIDQFRYDCTDRSPDSEDTTLYIEDVCWEEPEDFLRRVQARHTDQDHVEVILTPAGIRIPIVTDECPTYWTSFDDEFIVTDSYDSTIESTLQNDRSQVIAQVMPDFQLVDDYVPNIPPHFFQTWLAEAKATAFVYWRQEVSPRDEQKAQRGLAVLRREAARTDENDGRVKYGRRSIFRGQISGGRGTAR